MQKHFLEIKNVKLHTERTYHIFETANPDNQYQTQSKKKLLDLKKKSFGLRGKRACDLQS